MERFLSKHANAVTGTLSGFDRLVFRGTSRHLAHSGGMMPRAGRRARGGHELAPHAQRHRRFAPPRRSLASRQRPVSPGAGPGGRHRRPGRAGREAAPAGQSRWPPRRPFNPLAPGDAKLTGLTGRGGSVSNGFRDRDPRALLSAGGATAREEQRRDAAAVSRKLAPPRAHGLISKARSTRRYHLSARGRIIVTALISIRNAGTDKLMKPAA